MKFADVGMGKDVKLCYMPCGKYDIISSQNMSGEMHMRRRRDAKTRYSAAYPTGAERIAIGLLYHGVCPHCI